MTLLDTILAATAGGGGGATDPTTTHKSQPLLLDLADIFPKLRPQELNPDDDTGDDPSPLRRLTGWQTPASNVDATHSLERSMKKLTNMVRNPRSTTKDAVWTFLNSTFTVSKLSPFAGTHVVRLVADACVEFELWEMLETMIETGFFATGGGDLIMKLAGKKQIGLILVYLKHLSEPRASDVGAILGYFLTPTKESYDGMVEVRKEWERQGLFAIEKAVEDGVPKKKANLWREAAIMLMMAYDGFTASECCLHYLFGKRDLEGLAMVSAVEGLGGEEVIRLVRYFRKWVEKYQRFPQAVSCAAASKKLGLVACESVPSLENVVVGLGLVLDQHFGYLVMNPEFHEETRSIEGVVGSLATGADVCCRLANIIENLRKDNALSR